jgi:hypothetical protein
MKIYRIKFPEGQYKACVEAIPQGSQIVANG